MHSLVSLNILTGVKEVWEIKKLKLEKEDLDF